MKLATRLLFCCFLIFPFLGSLGCQPQPAIPAVDYSDDEVKRLRTEIDEMDWE